MTCMRTLVVKQQTQVQSQIEMDFSSRHIFQNSSEVHSVSYKKLRTRLFLGENGSQKVTLTTSPPSSPKVQEVCRFYIFGRPW